MTTAEFLAGLNALDFVDWVGSPELLKTKQDGSKWYLVNIRETKGATAVYRNIHYYVIDEGLPGETAFYKDTQPQQQTVQSDLRAWMLLAVDTNPNNYKGIQIHWISERYEMVVYSILIADASNLKWQAYYVRKNQGAPVAITNHEASRLSSIFQV